MPAGEQRAPAVGQQGGQPPWSRDRGSSGRTADRGRVFAMTQQDAQASLEVVARLII